MMGWNDSTRYTSDTLIARPPNRKYCVTDKELWDIAVYAESMGGDRSFNHKINQILDKIVKRHDK